MACLTPVPDLSQVPGDVGVVFLEPNVAKDEGVVS